MSVLDTTSSLPTDWTAQERQVWTDLGTQLRSWREQGNKIIVVTGVFDLFHPEHQNFLDRARAHGDRLVVGIESDVRVRELKGAGRPLQDQETRVTQVRASAAVDRAEILPVAFRTNEHYRAWAALMCPAILAVSSHSPFLENKRAIMTEFGGSVAVVYEQNPDVSTTLLARQRTIKAEDSME